MSGPGAGWDRQQRWDTKPSGQAHNGHHQHQLAPSGPTQPPIRPPRSRGPLIVGGALIVAAAMVSATLLLTRPGPLATPPASRPTPSAADRAAVRVDEVGPRTALPYAIDMQRLTGTPMNLFGDLGSAPPQDPKLTPAQCVLAANPVSQSTWKPARAMAAQNFLDGTVDSYQHQANTGLAVFATAADAAASLSLVTGSVLSCSAYTTPEANPGAPPATWAVTDPSKGEDRVTWTTTVQGSGYACQRSYRIHANVAASALFCGASITAGAATSLTDYMLTHATTQ